MTYELGKRYTCDSCGAGCMVLKPSTAGVLTCCGEPMTLQEAKKLPSSD